MIDFPRVLVISPVNFNQQSGSGVTMGNLFRGWPLDAIAQIHSTEGIEPDYNVCTNYFYLSPAPTQRPKRAEAIEFYSLTTGRLEYSIPLRKVLNWSREFAPDIIYARPSEQPSFYSLLPRYLGKKLKIPYVTRVLDDWPARYEAREGLKNNLIWKPLLRRNLKTLFKQAATNIGISAEMCEAYQERYGCKFVYFHNCIEPSEWSHLEKSYQTEGEFCLLYMGDTTKDKELYSLINIRDAVLNLRRQGYLVRLLIYGPPRCQTTVQKLLELPPGVVYGGYFPASEKQNILNQADLLVLPINFDPTSLTYIRYSLQTKVPEYMASGTPVLVYGPPISPNIRYAKREGWGFVVDEQNQEKLENAIIELIKNHELRAKLGQHARNLAFRNHDANQVRQQFHQLISDVAFVDSIKGREK